MSTGTVDEAKLEQIMGQIAGAHRPGYECLGGDVHGHGQGKGGVQGRRSAGVGDHCPRLFGGTEWFFRTGYRAYLPEEWIPALDGVEDRLTVGARAADVGDDDVVGAGRAREAGG